MVRIPAARLLRRLGPIMALALAGSLLLTGAAVAAGGARDHFKASATGDTEGAEAAELHDLQSFDENAAANQQKGDQALF